MDMYAVPPDGHGKMGDCPIFSAATAFRRQNGNSRFSAYINAALGGMGKIGRGANGFVLEKRVFWGRHHAGMHGGARAGARGGAWGEEGEGMKRGGEAVETQVRMRGFCGGGARVGVVWRRIKRELRHGLSRRRDRWQFGKRHAYLPPP